MKKIKLLFSAAALLMGLASGIAATVTSSRDVKYDWMDWNNEIILANATQTEAQNLCSSSSAICLRATANVFIYTTGYLPWQQRTGKAKVPATDIRDFETKQDSK